MILFLHVLFFVSIFVKNRLLVTFDMITVNVFKHLIFLPKIISGNALKSRKVVVLQKGDF